MRILGWASARVWCGGRQARIEGERPLALSQHGDCDQTSRERSDDRFVGALRRRTLHPLIVLRAHHSDSLCSSGAFYFSNGRQTVSRFLHARSTYHVSRSLVDKPRLQALCLRLCRGLKKFTIILFSHPSDLTVRSQNIRIMRRFIFVSTNGAGRKMYGKRWSSTILVFHRTDTHI